MFSQFSMILASNINCKYIYLDMEIRDFKGFLSIDFQFHIALTLTLHLHLQFWLFCNKHINSPFISPSRVIFSIIAV